MTFRRVFDCSRRGPSMGLLLFQQPARMLRLTTRFSLAMRRRHAAPTTGMSCLRLEMDGAPGWVVPSVASYGPADISKSARSVSCCPRWLLARYSSAAVEFDVEGFSLRTAFHCGWGLIGKLGGLNDGPSVGSAVLPPLHPGSGAVGNAVAYILFISSLGLNEGYIVLIDDDRYDVTNLNRCLVAGWTSIGDPKVDAVARSLRAGGIEAFTFPKAIKCYAADARTGLRDDVASQVRNLIFEIVVSCVNKGISGIVRDSGPVCCLAEVRWTSRQRQTLSAAREPPVWHASIRASAMEKKSCAQLRLTFRNMSTEELGQFLSDRELGCGLGRRLFVLRSDIMGMEAPEL